MVPPRVHPDLVERHRVAVDVERDRMLLDRLQPELTEDRYELGERRPRSAGVDAEAPVVTLGVDRPSERRGDRARRSDQRGDLAEVGDRVEGRVRARYSAVVASATRSKTRSPSMSTERVGDGSARLFVPGLRDPVDGVPEPFEIDARARHGRHRDPGERTRSDEGLRVAHLTAVVLGHERGDRVGQRRREPDVGARTRAPWSSGPTGSATSNTRTMRRSCNPTMSMTSWARTSASSSNTRSRGSVSTTFLMARPVWLCSGRDPTVRAPRWHAREHRDGEHALAVRRARRAVRRTGTRGRCRAAARTRTASGRGRWMVATASVRAITTRASSGRRRWIDDALRRAGPAAAAARARCPRSSTSPSSVRR